MTLSTPAQALAWIRRAGIATAAAHVEGVPCFVEAITGERIKGSWWGHPQGKLIFMLGESLDGAAEVMSLKLLDGKETFVHAALWPSLLAVVLDDKWRLARWKTLNPITKALWLKVEVASRRGGPPATVKALEESLLVHCASEHTETGRHEKRMTAWSQWAKARKVKSAGSCAAALKKLQAKASGHPTALAAERLRVLTLNRR